MLPSTTAEASITPRSVLAASSPVSKLEPIATAAPVTKSSRMPRPPGVNAMIPAIAAAGAITRKYQKEQWHGGIFFINSGKCKLDNYKLKKP
jgi:hypothetical protein